MVVITGCILACLNRASAHSSLSMWNARHFSMRYCTCRNITLQCNNVFAWSSEYKRTIQIYNARINLRKLIDESWCWAQLRSWLPFLRMQLRKSLPFSSVFRSQIYHLQRGWSINWNGFVLWLILLYALLFTTHMGSRSSLEERRWVGSNKILLVLLKWSIWMINFAIFVKFWGDTSKLKNRGV